MTILAVAQTLANRLQIPAPTTFIGSTSNNMILLLAMINETLNDLTDDYAWPELQKEYLFTLATSTANYALPDDFSYRLNETLWNRTQHWPLIGPLDAVLWQNYKSGLITTLPYQRYRVKGWQTAQFYIDPTPTSSENGQTCVYEYVSNINKRPKTWVALTAAGLNSYISYNGNIYKATVAGTTSAASPPTVTSGTVVDGTVTWTYQSTYPDFVADTDEILLNNAMIIDGVFWRFKRERGLDYQDNKDEALAQIELNKTKLEGASVANVNGGGRLPPYIGLWSYPTSNYNL